MGLGDMAVKELAVVVAVKKLILGHYKRRLATFEQAKKQQGAENSHTLQIVEALARGWAKVTSLTHDLFVLAANVHSRGKEYW